jgi:aminopeptidase N
LATESTLTIPTCPTQFTLQTVVRIDPDKNTRLSGMYRSKDGYFTQCEAQGFRRITWFLDRPDVMSTYTVTLHADKEALPILLANGNPVAQGDEPNGRHWARWADPFRKPCYLFALVAGKLDGLFDSFKTASGRSVQLAIYVEPGKLDQCPHAMAALQKSMRWDEERFGLECDLDHYMIVAVGDFNMGAMENKGLNIFNTKYVLARSDVATDVDFENIDRVVAHEYFHNWTGNRVTCRDWFQLSLKEGLTVFRDQEFGADEHNPSVARIREVRGLRAGQFPEDAGPMAHPVRPASFVEINNFYTATVYDKGAEVVRMIQTLIGRDAFRLGMDEYFRRHDGQAVTCEDFVAAMAAASGFDLPPSCAGTASPARQMLRSTAFLRQKPALHAAFQAIE